MRQTVADGKANDGELTGADGDTGTPAMKLQTDIRPKRQADVVALGVFETKHLAQAKQLDTLFERQEVKSDIPDNTSPEVVG
ncbi:MAG: hypothetical protein DWB42_05005 [Chloroflexi bacterium]|nr:hypothetical protein [Chloroflexota bacterium]MDL1883033.1 hypothetical protein [Anaerolineae bacterium CFX8]